MTKHFFLYFLSYFPTVSFPKRFVDISAAAGDERFYNNLP